VWKILSGTVVAHIRHRTYPDLPVTLITQNGFYPVVSMSKEGTRFDNQVDI